MRRAANTLPGGQTQRTIAAPMSRRTMMKTVGLGAAALAVPGLAAGCSSGGGRTSIVFEETKPEVVSYFNNLVAADSDGNGLGDLRGVHLADPVPRLVRRRRGLAHPVLPVGPRRRRL